MQSLLKKLDASASRRQRRTSAIRSAGANSPGVSHPMSHHNGRYVAAIAGLAVATAALAQDEGKRLLDDRPRTSQDAQHQKVGSKQQSGPSPSRPIETGKPAADISHDPTKILNQYERESLTANRDANSIAERANRIASTDLTLAKWQVILGALTGTFTGAAALFAWKAATETKRTADIAEKTQASIERPFLVVEIVESGIEREGKAVNFSPTTYRIRNFGRTPAIVTRRHFAIEASADPPSPVDPKARGRRVVHGVIIGPGGISEEYQTEPALPLISAIESAAQGRKRDTERILFLGFVAYRDLGGSEWVTGFCFLYDEEDGFVVASPTNWHGHPEDPYNYDRKLT